MALHFAWGDTKARYRRSMLGPLWIVLGTAIGVAGLGVLWSSLLGMDKATFIPSLTIGLVVWQFIAGCVTESTTVLVRQASIIRNIKTSFILFPVQLVIRQLITFGHNCIVILAVLLIFHQHLSATQLMALVGLLLVVGNLLWLTLLLGMLGARLRDLEQLVNAVMPMLFFLSPVIFRPSHLPMNSKILWLNPFTYWITVIRDPLQGSLPTVQVYAVTIGMIIAGWSFALWFLNARHSRIAFWV
jgi:lipopolysaccharide transport system permease protein